MWNKYAKTNQIILKLALSAPDGTFLAPKAKNPNPIPKSAKPKKYLTDAGGLYLLSHHLANSGANTIINSEFKIANQVIGTSVDVACDSLYILNIMIILIM